MQFSQPDEEGFYMFQMSYQKRGEPFFFSAAQRKQYGYVEHSAMNKTSQAASLALIITVMTVLVCLWNTEGAAISFLFKNTLSSVRPFLPFLPCIQCDHDMWRKKEMWGTVVMLSFEVKIIVHFLFADTSDFITFLKRLLCGQSSDYTSWFRLKWELYGYGQSTNFTWKII